MVKNFFFVCGDIGGTNMMVPVAQKLKTLGHHVRFVADGDGVGYQSLIQARLDFELQFDPTFHGSDEPNLVFISTCASTNKVEKSYARAFLGVKPVVFGSDGFFNHGYKWREAEADFWFAINEAHAEAIRSLRPRLSSDRIKVVGQPAFDFLLELIPRKNEIRIEQRRTLGVRDEERVFLWFSQGMPEAIEEDLGMMEQGIEAMNALPEPVFIPRVHPKLDKIKPGYVQEIHSKLKEVCSRTRVRLVRADNSRNEELCLASDVVVSITATDDIKNWLMGGPPVIHIVGPRVREWFEKDLLLSPPHYLPDIQSGEALMVTSNDEWEQVLRQVLDPNICQQLRQKWQPPTGKATERVARTLIELAS